MECFALFHNARVFNKKAACILTVVDNIETEARSMPMKERKIN